MLLAAEKLTTWPWQYQRQACSSMATAGGAARTIDFVTAHRTQPTFKGVENPKAKGKAKDGKPKEVAKEVIGEKATEKVAT